MVDLHLDRRYAIVGTSGSGKTYTARGMLERLMLEEPGARICIVDPTGVWWGLRAGVEGGEGGFRAILFGGAHADVKLTEDMGSALGRLVGTHDMISVIDLSEMGSSAARRRFMTAFAEALYDANREPLHLVLDEADLWAPQRPLPDAFTLLGRIEEIVRRGRVRGFIPWLISQRPAVIHKDVLSQADGLIAMKLTSSQDRDAVGAWIEGQADRVEGKRILADLPRMNRGEGYIWAPGQDMLERVTFPPITTFDSGRTPKRGERPLRLNVTRHDAAYIAEALGKLGGMGVTPPAHPDAALLEQARAEGRAEGLAAGEEGRLQLWAEVRHMRTKIEAAADHLMEASIVPPWNADEARSVDLPAAAAAPKGADAHQPAAAAPPTAAIAVGNLPSAARKIIGTLQARYPAKFTWTQVCTLSGLRASGGHFNAGRKALRESGLIQEEGKLVWAYDLPQDERPLLPPAESLAAWCANLPAPAPEMLRAIAAAGESGITVSALAQQLGKKPTGGHWNSGLSVLRQNDLTEQVGNSIRAIADLRAEV